MQQETKDKLRQELTEIDPIAGTLVDVIFGGANDRIIDAALSDTALVRDIVENAYDASSAASLAMIARMFFGNDPEKVDLVGKTAIGYVSEPLRLMTEAFTRVPRQNL